MRVSGFTFVRNGVQFDYPFEESLRSLAPLVDELVVNVGKGLDATMERVARVAADFPGKFQVFESVWDEKLREEGLVLSQQTNLALARCSGDWGVYLQADEVLHEDDYTALRQSLAESLSDPRVDGLLFDYVHFYGDFQVINRNPSAYRREVRAIRLGRAIESWKDAQGFRRRRTDGSMEKLRVKHSGARVFHYGWVRPPEVMKEKTLAMDTLYHADGGGTGDNHRYKRIYGLERFSGSHPKVMATRVKEKSWRVDLLRAPLVFKAGDVRKVLARLVESLTGWLPGEYKNYRRID
ncbi:MAG: glycosyltransferase family 2 protein [Bdellovibrionales bacterium]|nr:glycosyltransferase family 2 protein [Bdellovibrionales bacterium]